MTIFEGGNGLSDLPIDTAMARKRPCIVRRVLYWKMGTV